jgi:hypothetical protein
MEEEPPLEKVADNQLIRCFYPKKEERRSAAHGEAVIHHES